MKNSIMIAVALMLPAAPVMAQAIAPAGHGALAGRSPHHAYKTVVADTRGCAQPKMHSIPAGKLPTYGTHALPTAGCADAQIASAASPATARE